MNSLNTARLKIGFKKILLPGLAGLWLLAVVPGIRYLLAFEGTAGKQEAAPVGWPDGVPQVGDAGVPTLVVALHPRCSCSAATLAELEQVFEGSDRRFNAVLLITQPKGADYQWQDVGMYREAQKSLHATVIADEDGAYAARFGAQTSGDVLFYSAANESAERELLFAGGVTGGRGMTGENQGIELLKAAYHGRKRESHASMPVFGCGLFGTHFVSAASGANGSGQ